MNNMYKCSKCGKKYIKKNYYDKHVETCKGGTVKRKNKQKNTGNQLNIHKDNGVLIKPINLDKNIVTNGKKILFDKDVMIEIILNSPGSVSYLSKVYGVSFHTIKKYLAENPELKALMEEQQFVLADFSLANIAKDIIENENVKTSIWFLTATDPRFQKQIEIQTDIAIQVVTNNQKQIDLL